MQETIVSPEEVTEMVANEETIGAVALVENVDFAALIEKSQELKEMKEVIQINAEYATFEKGEVHRGIFAGFSVISIKNKVSGLLEPKKAARWVNAKKQIMLHAGAALVNEIEKAGVPVGTPIQIALTGLAKDGKTKIYQITILG